MLPYEAAVKLLAKAVVSLVGLTEKESSSKLLENWPVVGRIPFPKIC